MFFYNLHESWKKALEKEAEEAYFKALEEFLKKEKAYGKRIYPPESLIFNALNQTPLEEVKVVIVGQDPYHGPGQAHGLSFSVCQGIPSPPSLQNIFKEVNKDIKGTSFKHGCLLSWAHQGVLMLNAILTVEKGKPKSHHGKGWEKFTDKIIEIIAERQDFPVVFVLWGKSAQEKCVNVLEVKNNPKHLILKAPHPSPYSAHTGFLGCSHFSKINSHLSKFNLNKIVWSVN